MAVQILNASSSGLCLSLTGTTNRITMDASVESGVLHFRILGLPGYTTPPRWCDFGDKLHLLRQGSVAQNVEVVFRRYQQYIVAGQLMVDTNSTRYDWYGFDAFGFATFLGDAAGPRATWEDEQADLATTGPPTGYDIGYAEMQNQSHVDYLAIRLRRLGVSPGQTTTSTLKYLMLGGNGATHRDPKIVISVKTTPPVAADC